MSRRWSAQTLDEHTIQEREEETTFLSAQNNTMTVNNDTPTDQQNQLYSAQLQEKAAAHLASRDWSLAGEAFLELLDADPEDVAALIGLATVLDWLNRFEPLYDTAQHILEIMPNSAPGLALKARALQKMERLSEATIANDQALLLDTNFGLAWINRCGLQLIQEKFPEALRSARRATELAPNDSRAWANYGVALLNFNRLGEALDAFDRSLALDNQQLFALQMKGEILCRIGRMHEVIPIIRQVLTFSPQDIKSLSMGVQAFRTLEMYAELKALAHQLTQVTPQDVFAWENYMRSLRGLGEFNAANEALDQLLTLDTSNIRYLTMKADTLYRLERYRDAVPVAERARRLSPDYPPAQRIYEKALRMMYQRKAKKKS